MLEQFARTKPLIGEEGLKKLALSKIAVFGVGGVGSFAAEALCRAGVGSLTLIDYDVVCFTNINRQIHATHKTIGRAKVLVMQERMLDINPAANIKAIQKMCDENNSEQLLNNDNDYDYIIDAIDMVSSKIALIVCAQKKGIPIISSMGAGNKLDPLKFEVADIYQTSVCPLARVVRQELKKRGVASLKVIYSKEPPLRSFDISEKDEPSSKKRSLPGSISFVPSVAGLIIAGEVIKDILVTEPSA